MTFAGKRVEPRKKGSSYERQLKIFESGMLDRIALLAVLSLFPSMASQAAQIQTPAGEFVRSSDLLKACLGSPPPYGDNQDWCNGYLEAVADSLSLPSRMIGAFRVCVPDDMDPTSLREIAVAYMRGHPARQDDNAADVVASALSKAWPCR